MLVRPSKTFVWDGYSFQDDTKDDSIRGIAMRRADFSGMHDLFLLQVYAPQTKILDRATCNYGIGDFVI